MATKLEPKEWPANHTANDFQCFGPPATKDGKFEGTMICDCGCFTQDGKDSNKYYHGAVVQSKLDSSWWVYFEYARTGATNPTFQFVKCSSRDEAIREYIKQMMDKNWKRGVVVKHPTLGEILQAKAGKDCYLVRPQATRSTGLPDARTIAQNEGAKVEVKKITGTKKTSEAKTLVDKNTVQLMQDLNVGTISYTRNTMQGGAIPTQIAIDEARSICQEAQKRVKAVGDDIDDQIGDKDLIDLTRLMYSRIPKIKARNAPPKDWILSQDNIGQWQLDLDAFEGALYATNLETPNADPFGGMAIKMRHLDKSDPKGAFIYDWFPKASRLGHTFSGIRINNLWEVERDGDVARLTATQKRIASTKFDIANRPRHQASRRLDLSEEELKLHADSHTMLGFHGTRSVNVAGLLRTSWRLPSELVGVKINAWMFGPGIYIADDWGKSVGYTSYSGSRWAGGQGAIGNRGAFMFLTDAVIGSPYVAREAEGFVKAPGNNHSVCGKSGHTKGWYGPLQNNEFVVYDSSQVRARYLVEFDCLKR